MPASIEIMSAGNHRSEIRTKVLLILLRSTIMSGGRGVLVLVAGTTQKISIMNQEARPRTTDEGQK